MSGKLLFLVALMFYGVVCADVYVVGTNAEYPPYAFITAESTAKPFFEKMVSVDFGLSP